LNRCQTIVGVAAGGAQVDALPDAQAVSDPSCSKEVATTEIVDR